jgi:ELWxxDGT repeat protein
MMLSLVPQLMQESNGGPVGVEVHSPIVAVGNVVYFVESDSLSSRDTLWRSDGTPAGTQPVRYVEGGTSRIDIHDLFNGNGRLFFTTNDGVHGYGLWTSDGTESGTVRLKQLRVLSQDPYPFTFGTLNGEVFFVADDDVHGEELWKSDGTPEGTILVKDINPGAASSIPSAVNLPRGFETANNAIFFLANDGIHGFELWKSDGTETGTVLVADINSNAADSSVPTHIRNVGGTLFFGANDGMHDFELWKSDGTAQGTLLVREISQFAGGSGPGYFANVNGTVFFSASDGVNGLELWKSNGTADTTTLVKDIFSNGQSGHSYPQSITNLNGTALFIARPMFGHGLWRSDGTSEGTVSLNVTPPGQPSANLNYLTNVNGTLFFRNDDGIHGSQLWKTDGTALGSSMVKRIGDWPYGSFPGHLANANGTLFFSATDGTSPFKLWKSDGTATGTVLVTLRGANAQPSFTKGSDLIIPAGSGAQSINSWATGITAGPPEEAGQLLTFVVTASDTELFEILPSIDASGGLTFAPADGKIGVATVTVVLKDDGGSADGGLDASPAQIFTITISAPIPSPGIRLNHGVLEISGSPLADSIAVAPLGNKIVVSGTLGTARIKQAFSATRVQQIAANLGAGNDLLIIASTIRKPSVVDAGTGNDVIQAGGGTSVLIGGDGDDYLKGGNRRDAIIGGAGSDHLKGANGSDLLIAGSTVYDHNREALLAIQQEWIANRAATQRIQNLRTGGGEHLQQLDVKLVQNETLFDDGGTDTLFGDGDLDWFLLDRNKDKVKDGKPGERLG